jgi:hypothetical protein
VKAKQTRDGWSQAAQSAGDDGRLTLIEASKEAIDGIMIERTS